MKQYKKYVLGGVFACFMAVVLMSPIEKSEAFWPFNKIQKENNTNYTGAAVNTESNKIKPMPSITVISPNGGETLQAGKSYTIKWKSKGILKKDKSVYVGRIALHNEHGFSIDLVPFLSKYPTSGSLKWNIPQNSETGNNFKIQVILYRDIDGGSESEVSQDFSDGLFSIKNGAKVNAFPKITRTFLKRTEGEGYLRVGDSVSLTAEAFDADNDDLAWDINWGDGSGVAGTCEVDHKQNKKDWEFETRHIWEKEGSYTVGVTVKDCRGGTDKDATTVNIIGI